MVCFAKKLQLTNATRGLGLVVDILVVDSVVAAVHRHSQVVADSTHPHKHHPHRHLGLGLGVAGNAAHKDHRDHRQVGPVGPFHRGPCSHTSPAGAHRDHSRSYDWGRRTSVGVPEIRSLFTPGVSVGILAVTKFRHGARGGDVEKLWWV